MDDARLRDHAVSCQSLQVYLRYLQDMGLNDAALLEGHGVAPRVLRDPDARIDYATFQAISSRFSALFPDEPNAAYLAGRSVPRLRSLGYIGFLLTMRLDPAIIFGLTPRMVSRQFPMVHVSFRRTAPNRCRLEYRLQDAYPVFPELGAVAHGLLEATPAMVGLEPAKVVRSDRWNGFDFDVSWELKGRLLPRLRAATVGRVSSVRQAMTQLEAAKDRVEQQLAETHQARLRLEALLAIGRAVERGLDIPSLLTSFSKALQENLQLRLLHVSVFEDQADVSPWQGLARREAGRLETGIAKRLDLPENLMSSPKDGESTWAILMDGQGEHRGIAFVATTKNLEATSAEDRALLADAFGRLSHALGNALRHREISARGEELEREVESRTARITEQARQLKENNDRLLEVDRAKRRFFTHLSHELRTPASLLSASLERVESFLDAEDPDARSALLRARRNMARIVYAVDDLLDLALLEEARMAVSPALVDARELACSLVSSIEPWAATRQVVVTCEASDADLTLVGDPRLVEKALLNLIGNAIKFSPPAGTVGVFLSTEDDGVSFRVRDQGPGIGDDDRDRIFEPFEQVDQEGHRVAEQGIGIGLSLVSAITSLHAGRVRHENRIPHGSEFTMWLPRGDLSARVGVSDAPRPRRGEISTRDERTQAMISVAKNEPPQGPSTEPPEPTNGPVTKPTTQTEEGTSVVLNLSQRLRPTVLVVDDEPEIRDVLREHLETSYGVITAASGREALERAAEQVPSAVLADVSMPGMTGFELCRQMRQRPEMRQVPLVLLTAAGTIEDKLRGFDAGADDYVTKPFSLREVEARLRTHLDLRRLAAEVNAMSAASLMGSVSAGILHEVNNPLNVLLNALPPIEAGLAPEGEGETAKVMLELAVDAAQRIHGCVSSLSSLASWSKREREAVRLADLVGDVVRQHEHRGAGTTEISVRGEVQRELRVLRVEMSMVLGNLLANAIDAAGPAGHVHIVLDETGDEARVSISDDGCGMDESTLRNALEPFFTTKEPGKGMGLGLFLAQNLVQRMGGRLEAQSRVGHGTRMTVATPFDSTNARW